MWNAVEQASSASVGVAVRAMGTCAVALIDAPDGERLTTGTLTPQSEVAMVLNAGAEVFPSASETNTDTWYAPGTSGTSAGAASVVELSCARLPAGCETSDQWYA